MQHLTRSPCALFFPCFCLHTESSESSTYIHRDNNKFEEFSTASHTLRESFLSHFTNHYVCYYTRYYKIFTFKRAKNVSLNREASIEHVERCMDVPITRSIHMLVPVTLYARTKDITADSPYTSRASRRKFTLTKRTSKTNLTTLSLSANLTTKYNINYSAQKKSYLNIWPDRKKGSCVNKKKTGDKMFRYSV